MTRLSSIDGMPIIDAKRSIRLTITKRDIARAADSIKEPSRCAIAQACRRELHVIEARVHLSSIYLRTNNHNWVRYATPPKLRSEIIAFDRGGQFEPVEAVLKPRSKVNRGSHAITSKSGKKRKAYKPVANVRHGPA